MTKKGGINVPANNKKNETKIPLRLNILFFIVFIMFSVLVVQLGVVQILHGESFQEEIDRTILDISKTPVPRGLIYDRNGKVIVDNKPLYAISYTPPKRIQPEQKLELAEELVPYLSIDDKNIERITDRNKREYIFLKHNEEIIERISEEEEEELSNAEQYQLALDRITEEEVDSITDEELKVIAIKRELDKAYSLTPEIIKNDKISIEEYATIAEHLSELPGINATTDWERTYKYGDTLKSILGSITTQEQGIPAEAEDYYLTRGYNRNDRVGKSGLEEEYEDILRGRKEKVEHTTTKKGEVVDSKVVVPGERGKDLVLTIDIDFQQKLDEIVLDELKKAKSHLPGPNRYLEDALAVAMNPKTGEILALSAMHYDRENNKYEAAPHKIFYDAHRPGSTVKGATVMAGLQSGIITPGQVFYDRPIKIAQTPVKSSYATLGAVNDIQALKLSSNVYMFYIGLRMGGEYRHPFPNNSGATYNSEGAQTMRNYFHQFGLGVSTGVDFPFESTGFVGDAQIPGNLMDLGIGQYDTYTTLQLAQYVSTIANDGIRVEPRLVKEIRNPSNEGELGSIYKVNHPKVLNKLDVEDEYIKRVQEGFWKVFNEAGGTGYSYWAGKDYRPAGKTGTAENEIYEPDSDGNYRQVANSENLALVGYAPFEDPEIAFAIIVPNLGNVGGQYPINHHIGTRLMDTYFAEFSETAREKSDD